MIFNGVFKAFIVLIKKIPFRELKFKNTYFTRNNYTRVNFTIEIYIHCLVL